MKILEIIIGGLCMAFGVGVGKVIGEKSAEKKRQAKIIHTVKTIKLRNRNR